MQCEDARSFLQDFSEGNLSEAARNTVERHVADCAVCAADLKALGFVEDELKKQPVLPEPPGLVDRVMARIFPMQTVSFGKELVRFAAAALVLIAVTLGLLSINLDNVIDAKAQKSVENRLRTPIKHTVDQIDGWYRSLTEEK